MDEMDEDHARTQLDDPPTEDYREELAELCHDIYRQHLLAILSSGVSDLQDRFFLLPRVQANLERLRDTSYDNLPEGDRESFRKEADKFLALR